MRDTILIPKGIQAIKDTFTYGCKVAGVTIHIVDEKMDHGPIILQEGFKLTEKETLESLEARVHKVEHKLYPKAIALFAEGRLKIKGRRVKILEKPACPAGGPAARPAAEGSASGEDTASETDNPAAVE